MQKKKKPLFGHGSGPGLGARPSYLLSKLGVGSRRQLTFFLLVWGNLKWATMSTIWTDASQNCESPIFLFRSKRVCYQFTQKGTHTDSSFIHSFIHSSIIQKIFLGHLLYSWPWGGHWKFARQGTDKNLCPHRADLLVEGDRETEIATAHGMLHGEKCGGEVSSREGEVGRKLTFTGHKGLGIADAPQALICRSHQAIS